ncbi:hypothetical protein GGF43_001385 [Coemansia sp. RSA 2618]|nr:hypothetical protein GGF43_001385 [Coemansia sp. RSA 2618]
MIQDVSNSGPSPSHPSTLTDNCHKIPLEEQYAEANDPDRKQRRAKLGQEIMSDIKITSYYGLTRELGLNKKFIKFDEAAGSMFDDLARQMPLIDADGLFYPERIHKIVADSGLLGLNGKSMSRKERALTDHFTWLWWHLQSVAKPDHADIAQTSEYTITSYQTTMVPGAGLQPDGLFFHRTETSETFATAQIILVSKWETFNNGFPEDMLGQIGDYVLCIWEKQYTRIFVPVLVLHGNLVSMMVFTRKSKTLRRIWFYLTLTTGELGNICDVGNNYVSLLLVPGDPCIRVERTPKFRGNDIVRLGDRIKRPVRIFRQLSYMFWAKLDEQKVVLKLAWTPTNRYPEGAGYQVIEHYCKDLIPRVLRSGVLVPDFLGYRLECLVIEDSGITIEKYAADCRSYGMERNQFSAILVQTIRSIATCLAKSYAAGVIHRDVSVGNIAIQDGKARLIDWGCSRFRNDMEIASLASIEKKYAFNNKSVIEEELRRDRHAGTVLFMSIQILCEAKIRGLIHDLESLFYVGLYTYATFCGTIDRDTKAYPMEFQSAGNQGAAAIRVGCLSSKEHYLELFGVTDCPEDLTSLFDTMYRLLFTQNDEFIGGELLVQPNFERHIDFGKAALLFDTSVISDNPSGDVNAD